MTVENDGVPPPEGADGTLEPPTEVPADAPTATKLAADDAAARQAQLNAEVPPPPPPGTAPTQVVVPAEEPTQVLPVEPRAEPAEGTMEGDLFDGTERDGS